MSLDLDERQSAMLKEMGITVWWPRPTEPTVAPVLASTHMAPRAQPRGAPPVVPVAPLARTLASEGPRAALAGARDWPTLGEIVRTCTACSLCEGRKAPVFVAEEAPRQADWLVVGEPPDELEERTGAPFAGQAGELLDNMLLAVQLRRDGSGSSGARLTNVVKCRPALARNPAPEELAACAAHLWREVDLVRPRVILAMGRFAALSLLAPTHPELLALPFGKLRGTVYRVQGLPVVVTPHPARLLRAQSDKALAWADLCLAQTAARDGAQLIET